MRSEHFYTWIGMFVVGAFALLIIGSTFFYQEYLHAKTHTYVMFFKGSLKGLSLTTPVTYRGVKIGEVKLIELTENKEKNDVIIPVYVEFSVEKTLGFSHNPIHLLISNGYIAEISKSNFLTGNAEITLIQPAHTHTYSKQETFHRYPIFPTRNTIVKATSLDESIKSANDMFIAIKQLINSKEIKQTLSASNDMAVNVDKLAVNMDQYLPSSILYFNQTMKKISDAASSIQNFTDYLARNPEALLRGKQ